MVHRYGYGHGHGYGHDSGSSSPSPSLIAGLLLYIVATLSSATLAHAQTTTPLSSRATVTATIEHALSVGGKRFDELSGVAVNSVGDVWCVGRTTSPDLPTTRETGNGADNTFGTAYDGILFDAFVAQLDATGTIIQQMTYFGGDGSDEATGVAIDDDDRVWIVGSTSSSDLLARLSPRRIGSRGDVASNGSGSGGGGDDDDAAGVDGRIYGGGASLGGSADGDGFLVCVSAAGDVVEYGTYIGGTGADEALDVAVSTNSGSAAGAGIRGVRQTVFVVGRTRSVDGMMRMPADVDKDAQVTGWDAFVGAWDIIDGDGNGGAGAGMSAVLRRIHVYGGVGDRDVLSGVAARPSRAGGGVAITGAVSNRAAGASSSSPFPFRSAAGDAVSSTDVSVSGSSDAVVGVVTVDGDDSGALTIEWLAHFGGSSADAGFGVACFNDGSVIVVGETFSVRDFPTRWPSSPSSSSNDDNHVVGGSGGGVSDAFAARFASGGGGGGGGAAAEPVWSTRVGGTRGDVLVDVAVSTEGRAFAVGWTSSRASLTSLVSSLVNAGAGAGDDASEEACGSLCGTAALSVAFAPSSSSPHVSHVGAWSQTGTGNAFGEATRLRSVASSPVLDTFVGVGDWTSTLSTEERAAAGLLPVSRGLSDGVVLSIRHVSPPTTTTAADVAFASVEPRTVGDTGEVTFLVRSRDSQLAAARRCYLTSTFAASGGGSDDDADAAVVHHRRDGVGLVIEPDGRTARCVVRMNDARDNDRPAPHGVWTVAFELSLGDGSTAVASSTSHAVTVEATRPSRLHTRIVSREQIRTGTESPFVVVVVNDGNTDAHAVPVEVVVDDDDRGAVEIYLDTDDLLILPEGQGGGGSDGEGSEGLAGGENWLDDGGSGSLLVPRVPAGRSSRIVGRIRSRRRLSSRLRARAFMPWGGGVNGYDDYGGGYGGGGRDAADGACGRGVLNALVSTVGAIPGFSCIKTGAAAIFYAGADEAEQARALGLGAVDGRVRVVARTRTALTESAIGCVVPGASQAFAARDIISAVAACNPDGWVDAFLRFLSAIDPNEIVGPPGVGPRRWARLTDADGDGDNDDALPLLPYSVYFENLPKADLAARQVTVDMTLDTSVFDVSSVRFIGFDMQGTYHDHSSAAATAAAAAVPGTGTMTVAGGSNGDGDSDAGQRASLDMTVATKSESVFVHVVATHGVDAAGEMDGRLRWVMTAIDAATGEPPVDDLVGFLPPNRVKGDGEGRVDFEVRLARASRRFAEGTNITAQARIVFDSEFHIDTNVWANALDLSPPQPTALMPLPPVVAADDTAVIRWYAGDGDGSGVATVDVYVEVDGVVDVAASAIGVPAMSWMAVADGGDSDGCASTPFNGEWTLSMRGGGDGWAIGATVRVWVIATDSVGRREQLHPQRQQYASVQTMVGAPTTAAALSAASTTTANMWSTVMMTVVMALSVAVVVALAIG